jgi:hypothetical protein
MLSGVCCIKFRYCNYVQFVGKHSLKGKNIKVYKLRFPGVVVPGSGVSGFKPIKQKNQSSNMETTVLIQM